jgi:phosphoglycerate dehydrogenase-like enzyme
LEGKVLGLIGLGRIGLEVARKAISAFDMKVLAYDPFIVSKELTVTNVRLVDSLDELLKESDFISIHVPSTKQTERMIGTKQLEMMKPSSFLINTSRGTMVDEEALLIALQQGKIAGAALDVFEKEPPDLNHPFFGFPNVIATPHVAGMTKESVVRLSTTVAQGVLDVLQGRRPKYVFNPEVYEE